MTCSISSSVMTTSCEVSYYKALLVLPVVMAIMSTDVLNPS